MSSPMSEDEQASEVGTDPGNGEQNSVVLDVIAAVRALDGQPVEEHVAVFEQAHERLRRALDHQHG